MVVFGQIALAGICRGKGRITRANRRETRSGSMTRLAAIPLLALALHAPDTCADGPETQMFSVSGFGTFGAVHSSENRADFTSTILKPNGAGFTRAWSFDVDTLIAGQVTANFTPELSAVLQVISEQNYDNTYRPHVEWANIKYQVTPDLSVRAGRIVLPVFLVSDFRKVGFAFPWVRPPVEVYALEPVDESDGVDASYRLRIGEFTNTVQGSYGETEVKLPGGATAKAKHAWGISYMGEYGAATVRATYHRTNLALDSLKPLFDGFRQFGAEGMALADKYDSNSKPFTFIGLGGTYDPGGWFVMAEWGSTKSSSALGKRVAWYASGGYRVQTFTPYVAYAKTWADSDTSDPGLTLAGLPPSLAGAGAALNAGLNALLGSIPVQKTISAGVRWDFAKNVDLKVEFSRIDLGPNSPGSLINVQPDFQLGSKVNVFSATFDFVF